MQIRWYQQSSQGMKPATSEKKRLPPVAIGGDEEHEPELVALESAPTQSPGPRRPKSQASPISSRRTASTWPATPSAARTTIASCVIAALEDRLGFPSIRIRDRRARSRASAGRAERGIPRQAGQETGHQGGQRGLRPRAIAISAVSPIVLG